MDLDLPFDVLWRVREEDRRVGIAAAHLPGGALQRREELRVDERRLLEAEARRDVARHPEVRVLVDRARDEARHVDAAAEDVRERRRERREIKLLIIQLLPVLMIFCQLTQN